MKILAYITLIALVASCTKEVFEIPNSDIAVTLSADDFVYNSGDTITLTALITNLGQDDATDIEVLLKRRNTALTFVSSNNENYNLSSGILAVSELKTNEEIILVVKAVGLVPSILPTIHVAQDIQVLRNTNYDGNASNNFDQISIALIP